MGDEINKLTTVVRKQHVFDTQRLESYLKANPLTYSIIKGPLSVRQFSHGQSNPTFLLIDEGTGTKYVLRKKPPGKLLSSAHAVDREFKVIQALSAVHFPVPKPLVLCEDASIIGTPFYVMEFVRGRIFRDPTYLSDLPKDYVRALYFEAIRVLAKLHSLDYNALGLSDFGRAGNYFARQISRWSRQYEESIKTPGAASAATMLKLAVYLPRRIPSDDITAIVHGDFRLDNMIFHPSEPHALAVLDWELSTLGHPLSDLAYICMLYHLPPPYGAAVEGTEGKLVVEGIPKESELVEHYCKLTGRAELSIPRWHFYMAFALFRMAAIAAGVYARALQGNASSENAKMFGVMVEELANKAWEEAKKDGAEEGNARL